MEVLNFYNPHLYFLLAIAISNSLLMCFAGNKFLQIMQLSGYKAQAYVNWMKDTRARYISRTAMVSFISTACMLVLNAILYNYSEYLVYISYIFYVYFNILFIKNIYNTFKKTPLVQTRRMNRLIVTLFFIVLVFSYVLLMVSFEWIPVYSITIIAIVPITLPLLVLLAHFINWPLEMIINKSYIIRAKKELKKHPNLIKVGITGSYGKTSTKYILNKLLSEKYNVCMTPHSYNTPMGITKVILKYLKDDNEILLIEMGAKRQGDIKELCEICKPDYALLTPIGKQHLESFSSLENIIKTKSEILGYIDDKFVGFNCDNENTKQIFDGYNKDKFSSSIKAKDAFVYAENIRATENGSKFDLVIDGKSVSCQTILLGKHNIYNICLCAGFDYKMGVSLDQISAGICKLDPVPHRLELKKENNLIIIDNSYNSSIDGYKASLDTLKMFKKKKKIIVTPGLVELGVVEKEENKNFGREMAKVADYVVIVNKVHQDVIREGLLEAGFDENHILMSDTLKDATFAFKDVISEGDVILFENDLPDSYT